MTRIYQSPSPSLIKMLRYFILLACYFSFSSATIDYYPRTPTAASSWMIRFDKNENGVLDRNEFSSICEHLFCNIETSEQYSIPKPLLDVIFGIFDQNLDGYIDFPEFTFCYEHWIYTIRHPRNAFVIIDVQNDFISGSLRAFPARHNGEDVIRPINKLLDTVNFTKVYYSLDWHPSNHVSFVDNVNLRAVDPSSEISAATAKKYDTVIFQGPPKMPQRLWPSHCVQYTPGAEIHKDLRVLDGSDFIYKGTNPDVDSYSVFWDNNKSSKTELPSLLQKAGITDVYVAGLAYDVCVGASALDAQNLGYRTVLIDNCSRGVDPAGINTTRHSVWMNHGVVAHSHQVKAMVEGKDRRPELGFKLALELRKKKQNYANSG